MRDTGLAKFAHYCMAQKKEIKFETAQMSLITEACNMITSPSPTTHLPLRQRGQSAGKHQNPFSYAKQMLSIYYRVCTAFDGVI